MVRSLEPAERRRVVGRLAGLLFSVGAVLSVPANLLFHSPGVEPRAFAVNALAFVTGVICLLIPWDRVPPGWFHLIPVLGSGEVALAVWGVGGGHVDVYCWFFVFVAVFAAYAFSDRRVIAAHTSIAALAFALPLTYPGNGPDTFTRTLVGVPVLFVLAGIVAYLREELEARQRELESQASQDPLTGLGNRRLLAERLAYELPRHLRAGRELAVLTLDLDRFKAVNDILGHPAGDRLLRDVAVALTGAVREGDTLVRQGGDEFCVVAPETGAEASQVLAGRVQRALATLRVLDAPVSAGVGWAVFPADGTTADAMLEAADARQREAKRRGRRLELAA
jgi:diguanylate cyclase (GGDEF)-like protein